MEFRRAYWWVRNATKLTAAIMNELAGNARISFEVELRGLPIWSMPGASSEETPILRRNTLQPRLDFIIVPLEPHTPETIVRALGGSISTRRVIHVLIERNGRLEFAAYDSFHHQCIY